MELLSTNLEHYFSATASNIDTITDFSKVAGNTDKIDLSRATFLAFTANAASMAAGEFITTDTASFNTLTLTTQHIIYNTETGALYYDANAGTNGVSDAVQIALLGSLPTLTAADFAIVA